MNYRSKKGTVIKIPDGLSPKDIAAIKKDADAGYGTRAQQTANQLGKKAKGPKAPEEEKLVEAPPIVGPDGNIDLEEAKKQQAAQRTADEDAQFKLDHPDETDQYGNTVTYTRNPDGSVKRTVMQGETARKFTEMARAAAGGYNPEADRKSAEEATYGTITKFYDRDQEREMDAQKQEFAERGIPYNPAAAQDPNSENLYGRTLGGIGSKYQGLKDDASRQAVIAGNAAFATTSAARDSLINTATNSANSFGDDFGNYVNTIQKQTGNDDLALLSMSVEQYAKLRGLTLAEAQSKRDDATRRKAIAAQGKPGGGGGSSAPAETAGFEIVG